jgi:hypothetical protein
MKPSETGEILLLAKNLWQDQAFDEAVVAAWHLIIGECEAADVREALVQRARSGLERPTPGQVYKEAVDVMVRRRERNRPRAIEMQISEEQRRANLKRLHEMPEYQRLMGTLTMTEGDESDGIGAVQAGDARDAE